MKLTVKTIQAVDFKPYLLKIHYAKRIPSISYAYGAYVDKILKGVCTFGMPASNSLCMGVCGKEYKDKVLELNRLCVDNDFQFPTSQFLSICLKRLSNVFINGQILPDGRIIVSYADTEMGHLGIIYQATNWLYTGATKERTDISTPDGKHSRHYDKLQDYSINRKKRSSKHRYIYFIGSKKWKKRAMKNLKYNILEYPKGITQRYETEILNNVQGVLF